MTITSAQYDALKALLGGVAAKLSDWMYPVGSVVASVKQEFDPNKIYNGTWERFAKGQTLVGVNENDADFAAGKSGGEKSVQYTPAGSVGGHALTVNEMPSHNHGSK